MTAYSVAQSMTSNQSSLCRTCAGSSHRWTKSWLDEQVGPTLRCIVVFEVKEEKQTMYVTVTKNLTWNFPIVSRCFKMFQDVSRCFKMFQHVSRCFKMFQDVSRNIRTMMIQWFPTRSPFGFLPWLVSIDRGEVIQAAEGQDVRIEFFSKGGTASGWW
jgi:hypothetical protein